MDLNLKKHREELIFLPLGGANEIGMNLNLYHLDGKWLMIDCGVGFAYQVPGVDMMTPDITFIKQHRQNLLGIVLTHIHEDHLGAVQYLWQELQVPVYATLLCANFLRSKLEEFKLDRQVPIKIIDGNKPLNLAPFHLEFIGLTHSVPEMKAVLLKTRIGNVLHTGDWKFDPDPVVGEVSQLEKIEELGKNNEVLALVCDSTNAISAGHSRSEGELYESLKTLIENRQGLVGVSTFASNIARIHTIARIAKAVGRKIVLAGFSLNRLYNVAKKSGYFNQDSIDDSLFISDRQMHGYSKSELLVICTGCQGEAMASARKIATGTHPTIKFTRGDLMIFSSKIIPGNEKKIFELFDLLAKKQIDVMTEKDHFVHVSGHPSQDELRHMYDLARPKFAIPVHGEFIHTKTHGEIALECGVPRVVQIENGQAVRISPDLSNCEPIGFVHSGYLAVDGKQLLDLKSPVIRERRKLQNAGIVAVSLLVDKQLKLKATPKIFAVGSYDLLNDEEAEEYIIQEIQAFLRGKAKELGLNAGFALNFLKKGKSKKVDNHRIEIDIEKSLRSRLLKIFEDLMGKRPAIEIAVFVQD